MPAVPVVDSLQGRWPNDLLQDRQGRVWVATEAGLVCRDLDRTRVYTPADGLADLRVRCLLEGRDGELWIGTPGGLSRLDSQGLRSWRQPDGLGASEVSALEQDSQGRLFCGTVGGGVSLFDGQVFQTLTTHDGLPDNVVTDLHRDRHGDLWIATEGGVTRYRPRPVPPPVQLVRLTADRDYGPVEALRLPATQDYLAIEYQGRSLRTRPGQMAYVYRLAGHEEDWHTTREEQVVYRDLPVGSYRFEVKAVDRDLTYSATAAQLRLVVHPPYGQLAVQAGLGLALVGLVFAAGYGLRRRRDQYRAERALRRELEEELQAAHDLQMGLMPKEAPAIPGLSIAGRCLTANHVGGDFFQYFSLPGDRIAICITDVTGHAMDAAIPAVMFDGILDGQMRLGGDLEDLFARLNHILCEKLSGRTHVAFALAEIDLSNRTARVANAGCPYPCHYRRASGEALEVAVEAYPFGVRADTSYRQAEVQLEAGDYLVFYSDGLAEAANGAGGLFTFERTVETIRAACAQRLSAEAVIDHLLTAVRTFTSDVAQADDMTCVVVKVEE